MTQTEYVASGAGRCPFCRSRQLTLFRTEVDASLVDEELECDSCGRTFHRVLRAYGWKAGP